MTEPRPRRGSLYLVPVALGEHTPWAHFLPAQAQAIAAGLRHFVVETARAARAHLKQLDYPHPLRETDIRELPAEAADAVLDTLLAPALAGADLGLLSDAGCPAVADPGARLVARAHALDIRVVQGSIIRQIGVEIEIVQIHLHARHRHAIPGRRAHCGHIMPAALHVHRAIGHAFGVAVPLARPDLCQNLLG